MTGIQILGSIVTSGVLAAGCAVTSVSNKTDDPRTEQLATFFGGLHERGVFDGNVVVAEAGKVVFAGAFGLAEDATGCALARNSVLELASVGKAFTAMAVCVLVERDELAFDDSVMRYLPEFPYPDVTVRHLLNHTGGVPDAYPIVLTERTSFATNADVLTALIDVPLLFTPGSRFEYSNTGYVVLAQVLERLSGRPFAEVLQSCVFRPAGMRHTRAYSTRYTKGEILERYAFGYIRNDAGGWELPSVDNSAAHAVWLSGIQGDGNVVSTLDDMVRWDVALRERTLISEATWREATTGALLPDGTTTAYGFGWNLEIAANGSPIQSHTGGWPGTQAMIRRHPETQRLVFYVKNRETNDWSWLGRLDAIVNGG